MISLFALKLVVTSALLVTSPNNLTPVCIVQVNGSVTYALESDCKALGEQVYLDALKAHPAQPVHLIIDGFDYNEV